MFSVVLYFISVSNKLKTIPKHQIETMSLPEIPATVKSIHLKQAFIKRTSGNSPESLPTPPRLRRSVLIGEKRIQETQGSEKQVKSEREAIPGRGAHYCWECRRSRVVTFTAIRLRVP